MREFTFAVLINIAAGIFASVVFWLTFVRLPEGHRRTALRPKVELGIFQVYRTLLEIFDLIMQSSAHSPSGFQSKIRGGTLTDEDIELGLQNKILNETFRYDQKAQSCLMTIGKELHERAAKIDEDLGRLFQFSNYLKVAEILLLEQIRGKLHELKHFDRPAVKQIDGTPYAPPDPSLSYMKQNLWELYELFDELQTAVFKNSYKDRDLLLAKIQCLFYRGDYKRCQHLIQAARTRLQNDEPWLEFYLFRCEYGCGKQAAATAG